MVFPVESGKIALVHASMVVTYYVKLLLTGANKHNGILMSLLLLVAETVNLIFKDSRGECYGGCSTMKGERNCIATQIK